MSSVLGLSALVASNGRCSKNNRSENALYIDNGRNGGHCGVLQLWKFYLMLILRLLIIDHENTGRPYDSDSMTPVMEIKDHLLTARM